MRAQRDEQNGRCCGLAGLPQIGQVGGGGIDESGGITNAI